MAEFVQPRGARRWGVLIAGIVLALLALVPLIGGAVVSLGASVVSTVDPIGKARTPKVITFEARRAHYELFAVHEGHGGSIGTAAHFECKVTLADDRVITIDGSVQKVSEEVGQTESIGSFDAVPGKTVIDCDAGRDGETFIVDEASAWKRAALIATILGAGMLMVGAAAIVFGALSRRA